MSVTTTTDQEPRQLFPMGYRRETVAETQSLPEIVFEMLILRVRAALALLSFMLMSGPRRGDSVP